MSDQRRNVSIGLDSAPPVSVRLTGEQIDALNASLKNGGWGTINGEDAEIQINLDKVVYIRIESNEPKVGFGL